MNKKTSPMINTNMIGKNILQIKFQLELFN